MKTKKKGSGIVGGLIIFIVGIVLLWWNEGRTVKRTTSINEFSENYVTISSTEVDKNNNNKAIYVKGNLLYAENGVIDNVFNINVDSAVLSRNVEMYQWEEECTSNDNGSDDCTYSKVWSDTIIDSTSFEESGHENPTTMKYESERFYANDIKLDTFNINYFYDSLSTNAKYTKLDSETASKNGLIIEDNYYMTSNSNDLKVGDLRINFTYNDSKEISILGKQYDNTISEYVAQNGYTVARVEDGVVAPSTMIQNMIDENNMLKWIFRVVGVICIICGLLALVSPLQKLANYVPILGTIFNSLTSIIAFAIGLCISFLVIAIAWFRYRPILSICLIVAGLAIVIIFKKLFKKENKQQLVEQKQ